MNNVRLSFLVALATCVAALTLHAETEPLRNDLGTYTRKVTTKNPKAQSYFNQGLAFTHGFNHASAIRSFQEAANADPDCAMAHWGVALAAGPMRHRAIDRKSTRLNSSHTVISYAVFCLKKKTDQKNKYRERLVHPKYDCRTSLHRPQ